MPEYRVRWEIDVDGDTFSHAAKVAEEYQKRKGSRVFSVCNTNSGSERVVDLDHYLDPSLPVGTAEGHKVTLLKTNCLGKYPLVGVIDTGSAEVVGAWDRDGYHHLGTPEFKLINTSGEPS